MMKVSAAQGCSGPECVNARVAPGRALAHGGHMRVPALLIVRLRLLVKQHGPHAMAEGSDARARLLGLKAAQITRPLEPQLPPL